VADVTQILNAIEQGDPLAAVELLPLVYDELRRLAAARLVELRCFTGLSVAEAAAVLAVPLRTAERNWTFARTWLHRELSRLPPE
jgi:hypothetical protein